MTDDRYIAEGFLYDNTDRVQASTLCAGTNPSEAADRARTNLFRWVR